MPLPGGRLMGGWQEDRGGPSGVPLGSHELTEFASSQSRSLAAPCSRGCSLALPVSPAAFLELGRRPQLPPPLQWKGCLLGSRRCSSESSWIPSFVHGCATWMEGTRVPLGHQPHPCAPAGTHGEGALRVPGTAQDGEAAKVPSCGALGSLTAEEPRAVGGLGPGSVLPLTQPGTRSRVLAQPTHKSCPRCAPGLRLLQQVSDNK